MKIQNLEQFLQERGLEYMAIVGPRWESEGAKGKKSEDRFYVINSSLELVRYIRGVWRKDDFSSSVKDALDQYDRHETNIIYSHDLNIVRKAIFAEGEKAYNAYVIRQKRIDKNIEVEDVSKKFNDIIKDLK